jgi:hypothetical protein
VGSHGVTDGDVPVQNFPDGLQHLGDGGIFHQIE